MSQAQLSSISFHGDTIFCATIDGQPYTPAKPIVENMGLDWRAQAAKFRANKVRWGVVMIATPSAGGEQHALCLPVRKLPSFLASINPKKVRAELRPKIELYQAECDDALWNYWTKGRAERASAALPAPALMPQNIKPGVHLHSLEFAGQKLRAATKDGHLWIAVNDLGPALGYAAASGWLPAELPALWEGVLGRDSYDGTWRIVSPRQGKCCAPKVRMLSEEAVRAMIERCTKPQARDFETWLKEEAIPGLREEGWYGRVEALAESPVPVVPTAVEQEMSVCAVQGDSGVSQEVFQVYLGRMEQLRRIVEELLGKIHIGAKPYLLATAREQAHCRGNEDISLAMAYLNPFDEARDAFARGFRITRHMTQAASILSGRQEA